jgi:hypothetical protein
MPILSKKDHAAVLEVARAVRNVKGNARYDRGSLYIGGSRTRTKRGGGEEAEDPWVIVKWVAGTDGSSTTYASWTYDLYAKSDTGYVTKLNTTALQPTRSAARTQYGLVQKAPDGSIAFTYRDATGALKLWDCQELRATPAVCT